MQNFARKLGGGTFLDFLLSVLNHCFDRTTSACLILFSKRVCRSEGIIRTRTRMLMMVFALVLWFVGGIRDLF